jgi:hypothetical protein
MPGSSDIARGNEVLNYMFYLPSVTFPTLAANASGTSTVTLQGVLPLDLIGWNLQAPPAHLVLDNIYVSSANTLTLLWSSDSTGISTATVAVLGSVERATNAPLGTAGLPGAVV